MLVNGSKLPNCPVLSLHVGGPIARTEFPIVDPNNLKVIGFTLSGPMIRGDVGNILDSNDIREFSKIGMIIDSIDDFISEEDAIKIGKVLKLKFNLIRLRVETKKGTRLGKVIDYTVDSETMVVQQIIVKRPFLKAIDDPELIISRREIVEITDEKIIIKDEEDKLRKRAVNQDFIPNFVNPFREQSLSRAQSQSPDESSIE
jgi:sporulation protein YlmC with PRC-barrel domain